MHLITSKKTGLNKIMKCMSDYLCRPSGANNTQTQSFTSWWKQRWFASYAGLISPIPPSIVFHIRNGLTIPKSILHPVKPGTSIREFLALFVGHPAKSRVGPTRQVPFPAGEAVHELPRIFSLRLIATRPPPPPGASRRAVLVRRGLTPDLEEYVVEQPHVAVIGILQ